MLPKIALSKRHKAKTNEHEVKQHHPMVELSFGHRTGRVKGGKTPRQTSPDTARPFITHTVHTSDSQHIRLAYSKVQRC